MDTRRLDKLERTLKPKKGMRYIMIVPWRRTEC